MSASLRKTVHSLVWAFGALIFIAAGLISTAVFWINSQSGSEFLLRQLTGILRDSAQLELKVAKAEFPIWRGFKIENLSLSREESHPDGPLHIRVGKLEAQYSWSAVFSRSFTLHEFTLKDTQVTGKVSLPPHSPDSEVPSAGIDFSEIHRLALNPPLTVKVDRVQIEHLSLDLEVKQSGALNAKIQIPDFNGTFALEGKPANWTLQTGFSLKNDQSRTPNQIRAVLSDLKTQTHIELQPQANFHLQIHAGENPKAPGTLRIERAEGSLDSEISSLSVRSVPESNLPQLKKLKLQARFQLKSPEWIELQLDQTLDGLHIPGVTQGPLLWTTQATVRSPVDLLGSSESAVQIEGSTSPDGLSKKLLRFGMQVKPQLSNPDNIQVQVQGETHLFVQPQLSNLFVAAAPLEKLPAFDFGAIWRAHATTQQSPLKSSLDLQSFSLKLDQEEIVNAQIKGDVDSKTSRVNGQFQLRTVKALNRFLPKETQSLLISPIEVSSKLSLEQSPSESWVELESHLPRLRLKDLPEFKNNSLNLSARITPNQKFQLERFDAQLGEKTVSLHAEATGDGITESLQSKGYVLAHFQDKKLNYAGNQIQGYMSFPWSLNVRRGRDIEFEGDVGFKNFSVQMGNAGVHGINGNLAVSEKLIFSPEKGASPFDQIQFAHILTQNAFERVDYERFQPFFKNSSPLEIASLQFEEKSYGPLHGYFSIRQNRIAAHQFDIRLGSQGRSTGELFFDARPDHLTFGLLSRVTDVDLGELFPKRYLASLPPGNQKVSGRTGFILEVNKSTLEGRMDITQIGAPSLLALLNVMDPKHEDEKINQARFGLGLAHPTFVGIVFSRGAMDMTLNMSSPVPTLRLRGVPIAGMLSTVTAETLSAIKP